MIFRMRREKWEGGREKRDTEAFNEEVEEMAEKIKQCRKERKETRKTG